MEPDEFRGVVGRYHWDSTPWWPPPVRAPARSPNVVLVVLDDVGFAQLGCFGSDLNTPVLDGLAAGGLRYSGFHTTALCSPTRACVLTGRNHHSVGMGRIIDLATGYPGYDARISRANAFLPEMLVPHGYAAWAVGKWHLTPEEESHAAAPRSRWPLGRGFERFYGFFPGEVHQFAPVLVEDNRFVDREFPVGYHLTEDLVDTAVGLVGDLRAVDSEKPFFLYFCTGACHSPHQAPREWIDRYRGRFDRGWDVARNETLARQVAAGLLPPTTRLSPRPQWVPAWDDLSPDTRRVYARYMEAFAGYLSHTDHHLGRLMQFLRETGELDNTIVVVLSDNGASSEGGPTGSLNDVRAWNGAPRTVEEALARLDEIGGPTIHANYPWGWTVAGNTPFRRWKREVHEGGVADPLIVHWPAGIRVRGEIRHQYVHAIDIAPTILDALGVAPPSEVQGVAQRPLEGASFAPTFDDAQAAAPRDTQYYEMLGCRAVYHQGWKAVVYHPIQADEPGLDGVPWELYHVAEDPAETIDLAAEHPELLAGLEARWWSEAERYHVLPIDNRALSDLVLERPSGIPERTRYVYRPGGSMVPEGMCANVKNRSHTITARVEVPPEGAEGVLLAQGSILGGYSFFLHAGRLCYVHNYLGLEQHRVEVPVDIAPGSHSLELRYEKTAEMRGIASLVVDGAEVATGEIPRFTPIRFSITGAGLTCGADAGSAVTDDYSAPFRFTGQLHEVVVELDGPPHLDTEGEAEVAIATQ